MLSKLVAELKQAFSLADTGSGGYIPTPTRLLQAIVNQPTLSGCLPYSAYLDDERIFVNQDSLGFCLELQPQSGADEEMAQILMPIYAGSRAGTGIQFHLLGSPHIRSRLRRYANLRVTDANVTGEPSFGRAERNTNIYRKLARNRVDYYLRGARSSLLPQHGYLLRNLRLVLSVTMPGNADDLSSRLRNCSCCAMRCAPRLTPQAFPTGTGTPPTSSTGCRICSTRSAPSAPGTSPITMTDAICARRSSTTIPSRASPKRGCIWVNPRARTSWKSGSCRSRTSRRALHSGTWGR